MRNIKERQRPGSGGTNRRLGGCIQGLHLCVGHPHVTGRLWTRGKVERWDKTATHIASPDSTLVRFSVPKTETTSQDGGQLQQQTAFSSPWRSCWTRGSTGLREVNLLSRIVWLIISVIPAVNKYEAKQRIGEAKANQNLAFVPNSRTRRRRCLVIHHFIFLRTGDIKHRSTDACACNGLTTFYNIWFVFVAVWEGNIWGNVAFVAKFWCSLLSFSYGQYTPVSIIFDI